MKGNPQNQRRKVKTNMPYVNKRPIISKTKVISSQHIVGEKNSNKTQDRPNFNKRRSDPNEKSQNQKYTYGLQKNQNNPIEQPKIMSNPFAQQNSKNMSNPFEQQKNINTSNQFAQPQVMSNPFAQPKKEKEYIPYSTILRIEEPYPDISHKKLGAK